MNSKWKISVIGSLVLVALTACSNRPNGASFYPEKQLISVNVKGIECHLCLQHTKWNYGTYAVLQSAAEATLKSEHKLFSIEKPEYLNQSTINTVEEYVERCSVNPLDMLAQNNNPCKLLGKNRGSRSRRGMVIKVYNEAPLDHLTFDAEKVLATMKSMDIYETEHSIGKYVER